KGGPKNQVEAHLDAVFGGIRKADMKVTDVTVDDKKANTKSSKSSTLRFQKMAMLAHSR
ncbi:hypothetical protein BGZ98_000681, partial [Dissophora globulifera]